MPNLTVTVASDRPPVVELVVAVTEARTEALRDAGLTVPGPVLVPALLDTGAGESLITRGVADELGLEPSGARDVSGVSGVAPETGTVYRIRLFFAGVPAVKLASTARVIAVEDLSRFGVRMLLGRDLLSRCVLLYNGPHGLCTFAFEAESKSRRMVTANYLYMIVCSE